MWFYIIELAIYKVTFNYMFYRMSRNEKASRSSSLLESWFGRPKTKISGSSVGGSMYSGRPNSADGDTFDLQELERKISALTDLEVEAKFHEILEDMNIPKEKRGPLLSKSLTERQRMIIMHLKGRVFLITK